MDCGRDVIRDRPALYGSSVIAFAIEADRVAIIEVFHGGRNYQATLEPDDEGPM